MAKKASVKKASKKTKAAAKPAKTPKPKTDNPVKESKKAVAKKAPAKKAATDAGAAEPKPLSLVGAAERVLADFPNGICATELYAEIAKRGLWEAGKGKTPHQTLAAALSRLIAKEGSACRFVRKDRGLFGLAAA